MGKWAVIWFPNSRCCVIRSLGNFSIFETFKSNKCQFKYKCWQNLQPPHLVSFQGYAKACTLSQTSWAPPLRAINLAHCPRRDWQHAAGTYCSVFWDISETHKGSAPVSPITPPGARNSHCLWRRKFFKKYPNAELSSQHFGLHSWGGGHLTSLRSLLKCQCHK